MSTSNRPLSPHLQIYKPQITSGVSIFHRITGVALAGGMLVLIYWLGAAAHGPEAYGRAAGVLGSWFGYVALFGLTACFFYHLCNGIRHLIWDMGKGFEKNQVIAGGRAVLAGTAILTVLAWIVFLSV